MIHAERGDLTALHAPAGFPSTRASGGGESGAKQINNTLCQQHIGRVRRESLPGRAVKALDPARMTPVVVLPEAGPLKELFAEIGVEVLVCPSLAVITRFNFHPFGVLRAACSLTAVCAEIAVSHQGASRCTRPHEHGRHPVVLAGRMAGRRPPCLARPRDIRRFPPTLALLRTLRLGRLAARDCDLPRRRPAIPPSEKVAIVYDGLSLADYEVDHARMRQEFRTRFGIGAGLVVGCVGRIKLGRKGQDELAPRRRPVEATRR